MYDDVTVNRAAGRMYLDKKSLFRRCVLRDSCLNAGAGFMEQMSKGGGTVPDCGARSLFVCRWHTKSEILTQMVLTEKMFITLSVMMIMLAMSGSEGSLCHAWVNGFLHNAWVSGSLCVTSGSMGLYHAWVLGQRVLLFHAWISRSILLKEITQRPH